MRAKAGDPPRTMAQKVLAGRCADPSLSSSMVEVKVDQVVLARAPMRAFAEACAFGLKKANVEVAIAFDGTCITEARAATERVEARAATERVDDGNGADLSELVAHGIVLARPGVGYPSVVHLERFASPARLCVTDEPRLAGVGGIGMLSLVVSPSLLGQALAKGSIWMRPPRSIQVLLTGRVRPFVCARDVSLELIRRGLGEAVRRVEAEHGAPVVLEFAGPSARLLSVSERAVLTSLAPHLGAVAALFVSDERTEVFLRDQRRSKAHRALAPDAGAPCDEVLNVDLGAVDPLLMDEAGQVRPVRDLAGKPVSQVLLGGDSGITLRDLFAAAALLKSKRVPPRLDLLVSVPSRQMLEVLSAAGALTDLVATGARLIEPDARVMSGALYPPPARGLSLRCCDPEPRAGAKTSPIVASAETLAYAVATGEIGDPRAFKRPVRVTVPRALPTDDVLIARERRSGDADRTTSLPPSVAVAVPWKSVQTLEIVDGATFALNHVSNGKSGIAVLCTTLDDVRLVAARAAEMSGTVRAVLAPFIPSGIVALLSGVGIAAIQFDASASKGLKNQKSMQLPPPSSWPERASTSVSFGPSKVALTWLASGAERSWASTGTARAARAK